MSRGLVEHVRERRPRKCEACAKYGLVHRFSLVGANMPGKGI